MKKILAIVLVAVMAMSMMAVGAGAADATSANPAKILGEDFYAKMLVSFDEEGITDTFTPNQVNANACDMAVVDGAGASGKALELKAWNKAGWSQGEVSFGEADVSMYDGIMYYLDVTNVNIKASSVASGQPVGVGIRMTSNFANGAAWTRNDQQPIVENFEVKAYYLQDGTTEWKMSDPTKLSGERVIFPEQFKGWVYIPFDSYVSTKGPDGTPIQGFYGSEAFSKFMVLTGNYDSADGLTNTFILDDFQVVKLGTTTSPEETTEATTEATTAATTEATTVATQATTAATTAEATTAAATTAAATDAAKSGCGSSITVASVAVVMTSVLGSALVIKKRK